MRSRLESLLLSEKGLEDLEEIKPDSETPAHPWGEHMTVREAWSKWKKRLKRS